MTQRALPRSALEKTIAYTSNLWPGLVRFLSDPKIPLDTNSVERALRGVALLTSADEPADPGAEPADAQVLSPLTQVLSPLTPRC